MGHTLRVGVLADRGAVTTVPTAGYYRSSLYVCVLLLLGAKLLLLGANFWTRAGASPPTLTLFKGGNFPPFELALKPTVSLLRSWLLGPGGAIPACLTYQAGRRKEMGD